MRNIAAWNVLLRTETELPMDMIVPIEELGEGWDLIQPGDLARLSEDIQAHGWNLIKVEHGPQRTGVGETREEAISTALRLSLRHVSEYFNAAEVDCIELTEYPWFFLATVMLCPCRIQKEPVQPVPDDAQPRPLVRSYRRTATNAPELCSGLSAAMPYVRELLVLSRSTEGKAQ